MELDWTLVARYAAPLLALFVGATLSRLLESRPRVVTYVAHAAAIRAETQQGPPMQFYTHSVVVRNNGRKAANNLRLGHAILPPYSVYPPHEFRVVDVPGGRELVFPVLAPDEQITVAYLYSPPLHSGDVNTYTRSDEGIARVLNVLPTPQASPGMVRLGWFLMAVGALTTTIVAGQFILRLLHLVWGA